MFCFAPIILAGWMSTIHIPDHKVNTDSPAVEIMTCGKGIGVSGIVAPQAGLYGVQLQGGFEIGSTIKFRLIPQVGISHAEKHYRQLPLETQFGVGGEAQLVYSKIILSYKYWHLSNAGLKEPNSGLDLQTIMIGKEF